VPGVKVWLELVRVIQAFGRHAMLVSGKLFINLVPGRLLASTCIQSISSEYLLLGEVTFFFMHFYFSLNNKGDAKN
jgi:hypothetical protein